VLPVLLALPVPVLLVLPVPAVGAVLRRGGPAVAVSRAHAGSRHGR
jgi:hypothetical protein